MAELLRNQEEKTCSWFQKEEVRLGKENNVELSEYAKQGFHWMQIREIALGKYSDIDVTIYAKKQYFAYQMKEIRLGLEAKVAVTYYTNPEYDWFQMEEIRKGLEAKLDVSIYAKVDIHYLAMRQMRKGLLEGMNLFFFYEQGYNNQILRQLRKAKQQNIEIATYVMQGYDYEQLEQIRICIEEGIEIFPHITKTVSCSQMKEIRLGLERGLDVSCYQAEVFNWLQMREVRLGLGDKLEVTAYANPLYDRKQMREIRLGLKEGLDISFYTAFRNSAMDMYKRREWMKQNPEIRKQRAQMNSLKGRVVGGIVITISSDQMEATVTLDPEVDVLFTIEDVLAALKEQGVVQGILVHRIQTMLKEKEYAKPILVAVGKLSEDGEDGYYEYFFQTHMPKLPKPLLDGAVDYQTIEFFEIVELGQKLAYYHEATPGVYGYQITGRVMIPNCGRNQSCLSGSGFQMKQEENTYYASIFGRVELKETCLTVNPLYVHEGDLTVATGDIYFDGDVLIKGNIATGVTVEASGDLLVEGKVEGAYLKACKHIIFREAVCTKGEGKVEAGDSIWGKSFEDAVLYAENEIRSNYMRNTIAFTKGKILVSGRKGAIIGGEAHAVYGITSFTIGSSSHQKTILDIGMNQEFIETFAAMEEKTRRVASEIELIKKRLHTQCKDNPFFGKLQQTMSEKEEERQILQSIQTDFARNYQYSASLVQIRVMGNAYPGCIVTIDQDILELTETASSVIFKKQGEKVEAFSGRI